MMTNEITIDVQGFKKVLDMVKSVIPARPALPVMKCVRLDWDRETDEFTLTGSNGDQYLMVRCEAMDSDTGEMTECVHMFQEDRTEKWHAVCMDWQSLRDLFGVLPAARRCKVTFTEKADGARLVTIDYQDGKMTLPYYSDEEYPLPAEIEEKPLCRFTMNTNMLTEPVKEAQKCCASDELRPVMETVCMDCYMDKMVVVASDGHVLYKNVVEVPGYMKQVNFPVTESAVLLLPKQAVTSVVTALGRQGEVMVTADTQHIRIETDGVVLITTSVEGHYPNYDSVIPRENPYKVQISRETLKMALKRVQLAADGATNLVRMRSDGQAFILEASSVADSREGKETVPVQQTDAFMPEGFKIGVKVSSLLMLLDLLDEDAITFFFSAPDRAFLLKNESVKLQGKTLLQMPMLAD